MKVGDLVGHAFDTRIKGIIVDLTNGGLVRVFWYGKDMVSTILPQNLIVLS